jgi:murein DD-endopeptidase MepM/ murein hydrolase activator NlpD
MRFSGQVSSRFAAKPPRFARPPLKGGQNLTVDGNTVYILSASLSASPHSHIATSNFLLPPVRGYISAKYEPARDHYALDLVTAPNAPVKAVADGVVIFSEWSSTTGNVIVLQHPDNLLSVYKHNSVLLKKHNTFVKAGEAIALVGNSGELTTGPHLHFELWKGGQTLDPEEFIAF